MYNKRKSRHFFNVPTPVTYGIMHLDLKVRLYRKSRHSFNVYDSCTVSMCNVKMRNVLIKGTYYTTKRIIIKIKSHQDDGRMLLIIIILWFDQNGSFK